MEVSHRGKYFMELITQAEKDLREVYHIPDNYRVLFLQGGARGQFAALPMNLIGEKGKALYLNSATGLQLQRKKHVTLLKLMKLPLWKMVITHALLILISVTLRNNTITFTIVQMKPSVVWKF